MGIAIISIKNGNVRIHASFMIGTMVGAIIAGGFAMIPGRLISSLIGVWMKNRFITKPSGSDPFKLDIEVRKLTNPQRQLGKYVSESINSDVISSNMIHRTQCDVTIKRSK